MVQGGPGHLRQGDGAPGEIQPVHAGLQHPVQLYPVHAGPPLGRDVGRQPGPQARPAGAGRGPLRAGPGEGAHRGVPRRPQAEGEHEVPDPVPVRPSGRGQDQPRQERGAGPRAQVRAHLPRRHARRGGDPRPPENLRGRPPGPDPERHPPGRHLQPGHRPGRDRQALLRLQGRPVQRAAGSPGPGAEQHLPRQLPGHRL